jgi:hypothetical protein
MGLAVQADKSTLYSFQFQGEGRQAIERPDSRLLSCTSLGALTRRSD